MYQVSKYHGFQNFKLRYMSAIKYISKSKDTLKLFLNIWVILSSNKIQKQKFVNDIVKNLLKTTGHEFRIIRSSTQKELSLRELEPIVRKDYFHFNIRFFFYNFNLFF